jgi:hypothetical protein
VLPKPNSSNQIQGSPAESLGPDVDQPTAQAQLGADEQNPDDDGSTMQAQATTDEHEHDLVPEGASHSVPAVQPSGFASIPPPSSFYERDRDWEREREQDQIFYYNRMTYRHNRSLRNCTLVGGASLILGIGAIVFVITQPHMTNKSTWIISVSVAAALVVLYCVQTALRSRKWLTTNRSVFEEINRIDRPSLRDKKADSQQRGDGLRERREPDDARTNNQLLIDRYHQLTTQQAATSYRNSQIAMTAGLALLVAGAVITIRTTSGSAQLVVGALTALGAALSAYLGATFIRTYERALLQMNYYFGQPLVTSYILEAERLSGKLSKTKRDDALSDIINETLLGASSASRALSPGPQDQIAKWANNRTRSRFAEKEAKTADSQ